MAVLVLIDYTVDFLGQFFAFVRDTVFICLWKKKGSLVGECLVRIARWKVCEDFLERNDICDRVRQKGI